MAATSFLIIEGHKIFRQALLATLEAEFPEALCASSGTLREGKNIMQCMKPMPIVMLGLDSTDGQRLDTALELLQFATGLKIIALSTEDSTHFRNRLLKLGVYGLLPKTTTSPELFIRRLRKLVSDR